MPFFGTLKQALLAKKIGCSGMSQLGDQNAQLAAGRRQAWGREEERARGEREAAWVETVTGRDIVRRGRFWGT